MLLLGIGCGTLTPPADKGAAVDPKADNPVILLTNLAAVPNHRRGVGAADPESRHSRAVRECGGVPGGDPAAVPSTTPATAVTTKVRLPCGAPISLAHPMPNLRVAGKFGAPSLVANRNRLTAFPDHVNELFPC